MHDPPAAVRTQEGLVDRRVSGAGARRQGRRDGERGQHRRRHGRRAAAHGSHQGRGPPRDRGADPGARARRRRSSSTAAPPSTAPPSGCVQFAVMGREYARIRLGHRRAPRRPAVERRGAGQGRRRCARPSSRCSRRCPGSSATSRVATSCTTRVDVIVTDGFTGNVALKTVEGAIRGTARPGVRHARCPRPSCRQASEIVMPALLEAGRRSSTPTPRAAACCSASTASA